MANIEVICGDALTVMKTFKDGQFDLCLTDPPYGLDKKLSCGGGKHKEAKFRMMYEDKDWDKLQNLDESFRVSENQIIFGGNYYQLPPTRGIICWDKLQFMPTFSRWEYAWTSFDFPSKLVQIQNGQDSRVHPTQKPVELMVWCLKQAGQVKTVIDPYMGSGSTLCACERMGIDAIGIDISPEYCAIARKRIAEEKAKMGLFAELEK